MSGMPKSEKTPRNPLRRSAAACGDRPDCKDGHACPDHSLERRIARQSAELSELRRTLAAERQQRLHTEHDLKHNQQLLHRVFESFSDPLILMDEKSHVMMVNPAAQAYYGIDMIAHAIQHICFEGLGRFRDPCQSCRVPKAVNDGRQMEFERPGFSDPERTEVVELFPIKDEAGSPKGAVMRIHDITERKDTHRQIWRLRHQASIGMLVSSVAHEIKNPNSFIAFNISVLRTYLTELLPLLDAHAAAEPEFEVANMAYGDFRRDVFKLMDTIEHGSRRIDAFLGNLKMLGPGRPRGKCIRTPLTAVIASVLDTVRSKIEKTVSRFDVDIQDPLPDVHSDPCLLEQVLTNLLVNAVQAADKGDAYIRLRAHARLDDRRRVMVMVEDNGHGMDAKTRRLIFEPFYSTKVAEGGTGLGLYVCRNLLDEIGGRLHVESELGKGSRFTVELPLDASACAIAGDDTRRRRSEDTAPNEDNQD